MIYSDYCAVFHFRNADGNIEPLYFCNPVEVVSATEVGEVLPAMAAVEKAVAGGRYAAGFVAYEAAPAFDPAFRVLFSHAKGQDNSLLLLWFGIYEKPISGLIPPVLGAGGLGGGSANFEVPDWGSALSPERYADGIRRIRAAIAEGLTYQVNYTMRLRARFSGDDFAYFERLRRSQGAGYAAYLNVGRHRILSVSPELFFHRKGGRITTKPMKGTITRGRWSEEDRAHREWLRHSDKNRAENVMIVDLLRNDLGRIAETGSVSVDDLFAVEAYPTVFQMTSTVSAVLAGDPALTDIFRALFPCGSVTGAPKISTMKLIAEIENEPRRAYCGAIGYITPNTEAVFNVAIRTVTLDAETGDAEFGTGGGITWDSDADDEYRETAAKSAVLREEWPDFDLLETLCLREDEYVLLDRHLERLTASAEYFSIPVDVLDVRRHLDEYAREYRAGTQRVRLLVGRGFSDIRIEGAPLTEAAVPVSIALADEPIDSRDRFLYHKTTHRAVYESRKKAHPEAFDVLLWNADREITEFTFGNVVVELDGRKWTPPLACGLLPGTLRAELLARGEIAERVIRLDELARATNLWFINSVRGWLPVAAFDMAMPTDEQSEV